MRVGSLSGDGLAEQAVAVQAQVVERGACAFSAALSSGRVVSQATTKLRAPEVASTPSIRNAMIVSGAVQEKPAGVGGRVRRRPGR